jgi:hypothetical protein
MFQLPISWRWPSCEDWIITFLILISSISTSPVSCDACATATIQNAISYFARQHTYEADFFDERDLKWLDRRWVHLQKHDAAAS